MSKVPQTLRDLMFNLPGIEQKDFRDSLFLVLPQGRFIARSENVDKDIDILLEYTEALGRVSSDGELAIDLLERKLLHYFPPDTGLGAKIQLEFEAWKAIVAPPPLTAVPQPPPAIAPEGIQFTNRQDEMAKIMEGVWPHYLIDGPAGFGKTKFMQELKNRFTDKGYIAVYVSLLKLPTMLGLAQKICHELGVENPEFEPTQNAADLADDFCKLIGGLVEQGGLKSGLVLLLDDVSQNTQGLSSPLLLEFLPVLFDALNVYVYFSEPAEQHRFRVILAGRYLSYFFNEIGCSLIFHQETLRPFDFDVVYESLRKTKSLSTLSRRALEQLSAHTIFLTGGHPDCISELVERYKGNTSEPQRFIDRNAEIIWKEIVQPRCDAIWTEIDHLNLRPDFEALSFYRFFDEEIIRKLMEMHRLDVGEPIYLIDDLTCTYLITSDSRRYSDAITRRLLATSLRYTLEKKEFETRCNEAYDIYLARLKEPDLRDRELWALECIYQRLQGKVLEIGNRRERTSLREDIFEQISEVILPAYIGQAQYRISEINALVQKMDEDWELRFLINYCLREDSYNTQPYQDLRLLVKRKGEDAWPEPQYPRLS